MINVFALDDTLMQYCLGFLCLYLFNLIIMFVCKRMLHYEWLIKKLHICYDPILEQVIIVDDGSADGTKRVAFDFVKKYTVEKVRLVLLGRNHGKGEAIRKVSHSE